MLFNLGTGAEQATDKMAVPDVDFPVIEKNIESITKQTGDYQSAILSNIDNELSIYDFEAGEEKTIFSGEEIALDFAYPTSYTKYIFYALDETINIFDIEKQEVVWTDVDVDLTPQAYSYEGNTGISTNPRHLLRIYPSINDRNKFFIGYLNREGHVGIERVIGGGVFIDVKSRSLTNISQNLVDDALDAEDCSFIYDSKFQKFYTLHCSSSHFDSIGQGNRHGAKFLQIDINDGEVREIMKGYNDQFFYDTYLFGYDRSERNSVDGTIGMINLNSSEPKFRKLVFSENALKKLNIMDRLSVYDMYIDETSKTLILIGSDLINSFHYDNQDIIHSFDQFAFDIKNLGTMLDKDKNILYILLHSGLSIINYQTGAIELKVGTKNRMWGLLND